MTDETQAGPWTMDAETLAALRVEKARKWLLAGDDAAALVEAEELLLEQPAHAEALLIAGRAALRVGDARMSEAALEHHLELSLPSADALAALAIARFQLVDYPGARRAARHATQLDPNAAMAWYYLGLVLERSGEQDDADAAFTRATQLAPDDYPPAGASAGFPWDTALGQAVAALPGPLRAYFAEVPVEWARFPDPAELRRQDPPLSPFADALYVGTPPDPEAQDPWTTPPAAVRLFQGNLARPTAALDDVADRISRALMHEALDWLSIADWDADLAP